MSASVRAVVVLVLVLAPARIASGAEPAPPAETGTLPVAPEFVFAAIADSHICKAGARDDYRHLKALSFACEILTNYVNDINAHQPKVDFVIHLGDITDFGRAGEFQKAGAILDRLECPLYPVVGNHDNFQSDNKRNWKRFAGMEVTNYTFDYGGLHFAAIDCTPNPYRPDSVDCDCGLRDWLADDLEANRRKPSIILSHYNMWERGWNAEFDTIRHYVEYGGMPELRQVLEKAGSVVAVMNGHVHANRVEVHGGIYYIDIGATLVGRPSIRYFSVYPDRIEVDYEYLSGELFFENVEDLCSKCTGCFDRSEVCDYIDGTDADKRFTIPIYTPAPPARRLVPKHFR
jgi:predicted phosphodiesterase